MSEIANNEGVSETEKPVQNDVKFPPFPEPTDKDFDEDIPEEERNYYRNKFKDLNDVKTVRLHCTSCDRHLGCSARNERMRAHPMLRTLVCHSCHTFYNSGEFEKGDDGSELYCRWCGQGGQVYCCSDCPHVFCAKCIKRNLGVPKIKEIENADDWRCFKCNPECLMNLRAICWAVLRYCDLKNKITYLTEDPELKAALQKECALDLSECCKHKTNKRNQRINDSLTKKKEIKKEADAKLADKIISKMPPTIQVKKFASVNPDDSNKAEKKAQKRPASPKLKSLLVKNPVPIAPNLTPRILGSVASGPSLPKKIRLPTIPIRFPNVRENKVATYTRIRPKIGPQLPIPIVNNCFNGFVANAYHCPNPINDNINLSLESLTQGLDMTAVATIANNNSQDDDVVCTPDFPLEPLCEVTEDNDDDVECITPGPVVTPKMVNPPPLVPRSTHNISDVTSENIIQMTENDVTVNEATGGLKFRVDPQTLSSNKMYRLPDGRIFAINSNPNMPGGYSATIVAVTEANKGVPKGATFAAKLSSVSTSTPAPKSNRNQVTRFINTKRIAPKAIKVKSTKTSETSTRECDLSVPVEWYRYNLIDAVDALEYSLSRLQKLKKDATSVYLRTRSVNEMRNLHRTLERLLNTSSSRFNEIRENLNKGLKQYVQKKSGSGGADGGGATSEEDDDVEILPDIDDDPIFIDENSVESNMNGSENQEVDLTGPGSSEYNGSGENRTDVSSKGDPQNILDDNTGQIINIRSLQDISKNDEDSGNKVNGVQSTRRFSDLKCKSVEDINRLVEQPTKEANAKSKNVEDNDVSLTNLNDGPENQVKHEIVQDSDDKMEISDDKDRNSDDNIQNSDDKLQNSTDKLQDSNDKLQDSSNTIKDSDDKVQVSDDQVQNSDDKLQDSVDKLKDFDEKLQDLDDKLKDSDDKLQGLDDKLQDSDDKLQDSNDKGHDSDENILDCDDTNQTPAEKALNDANEKHTDENTENLQDNLDDSNDLDFKIQDAVNKTQNTDDKMQDTEMSEEMIETLLKDDNSQDSATTNSEISKALSVI